MDTEPLFSFYDPLSSFSAPDQHYWGIYSRIMLDSGIDEYSKKKETVIRELNLISGFDYEDAHLRRLGTELYISPIYVNVFLRTVCDGSDMEKIYSRMVDYLSRMNNTENISSIYHNDWYMHQMDIDISEPFSILLMGSEKDIESRLTALSGKPEADDMHMLVRVYEAVENLSRSAEIIGKRPRRSLQVYEDIIRLAEMINGYNPESMIRISLEKAGQISMLHLGREISLKETKDAIYMLEKDLLIDFLDFF
jgi:hypothetical protein